MQQLPQAQVVTLPGGGVQGYQVHILVVTMSHTYTRSNAYEQQTLTQIINRASTHTN